MHDGKPRGRSNTVFESTVISGQSRTVDSDRYSYESGTHGASTISVVGVVDEKDSR